MQESIDAIQAVRSENKVGIIRHPTANVAEVYCYSKHWICLFPQHGPGPKNKREIRLRYWQQEIVNIETPAFVRGLMHSDGCRSLNVVNGTGYPRYFFSNTSTDILRMMGGALDRLGVEWRYNRPNSISVARRGSVALLDQYVGPKY
jgi:hypothetical protein